MPFSEALLPEFEQEMRNTRKILELVPDDKFDYKPHPKSMALGRLASHLAELPGWTTFTIDQEEFNLEPDFKPDLAKSRAELLQKFDQNVAAAQTRIKVTKDDDWNKTWTFKFGGKVMMQNPRTSVMRTTIMNHLIHHRAQLGVYLRLNDIAIPGMYGPSADENFG